MSRRLPLRPLQQGRLRGLCAPRDDEFSPLFKGDGFTETGALRVRRRAARGFISFATPR